jgi:SAM-dependent methyltransferase
MSAQPASAAAAPAIAAQTIPVCPACGEGSAGASLATSYGASLYACDACDLHFWSPVKMPDATWYEATYHGRDRRAMPLEPGHRYFLADPKAPKRGRLLDLGCGVGNFLAAARDAGFECVGVEPDKNAVRFAKDHYKLAEVHALTPAAFRDAHLRQKFQIVTFFEVLEHQDDPKSFLQVASDCLEDHGWIAMSVPNRNRWQVGEDANDFPPNHLTKWSPRALENFLTRNGFEIVSLREETLRPRRAAQMLSASLRTGMVSRIAGTPPATTADLAAMDQAELERAMARPQIDRGLRVAEKLSAIKNAAAIPAAAVLLPYFRLRGYTGLYLYCLARRVKPSSAGAHTRNANPQGGG